MIIKKVHTLQTPFDYSYDVFVDYIEEKSCFTESLKKYLVDKSFFNINPHYYLYYPKLFCDISLEKNSFIDRLSVAGFLLYRSTLIKDEILDNNVMNFDMFSLISSLQEEAIRILKDLYGNIPEFWEKWEIRNREYYDGYRLDKSLKTINSFEDYIHLCDLKSSIGKIAIDGILLKFNPVKQTNNDLYLSHKYFYVAFQILDDIQDIIDDIDNKQFNIAYYELEKELKEINLKLCDLQTFDIKKYLHLTGVSNKLREKAILYLKKAEILATGLNLPFWISEIQRLNNTITSHVINTVGYIKYVSKRSTAKIEIITTDTIVKAKQYIEKEQLADGSWNEIFNSSGVSDTWATAFILSFLKQKQLDAIIDNNTIDKAIVFLSELDGLWGYNKYWISDCDSIIFSLLSLLYSKTNIDFEQHTNRLISLIFKSGGFSTYTDHQLLISSLNQNEIIDVNGWMIEHGCVSSAAFLYLCQLNSNHNEREKILEWLLSHRNKDGLFSSYWWTSPLYSSAFVLKGLLTSHKQNTSYQNVISETINAIIKKQNPDGSFGDTFIKHSSFYTGLVLDALCEDKYIISEYRVSIEKGIRWIQKKQLCDGSWESSYAMRMPHPSNIAPSDIGDWPIATIGTQIRTDDYNRMFSTVVCLSAFCKYKKNA